MNIAHTTVNIQDMIDSVCVFLILQKLNVDYSDNQCKTKEAAKDNSTHLHQTPDLDWNELPLRIGHLSSLAAAGTGTTRSGKV